MGLDDAVGQLTAWLATGKQSVITALPNLATALLVLVVGWGLAWVLRRAVLAAFRRIAARLPPGLTRQAWMETVDDQRAGQVAAGGLYWLVLALAAVIAVNALDVPLFSGSSEASSQAVSPATPSSRRQAAALPRRRENWLV
jgi:hypothetical protein